MPKHRGTASVLEDLDVLAALDRTVRFTPRDKAHNGFEKVACIYRVFVRHKVCAFGRRRQRRRLHRLGAAVLEFADSGKRYEDKVNLVRCALEDSS